MGGRVRGQEGGAAGGRPEDISGRKTLEDAGGHHKNGGRQVEPDRF